VVDLIKVSSEVQVKPSQSVVPSGIKSDNMVRTIVFRRTPSVLECSVFKSSQVAISTIKVFVPVFCFWMTIGVRWIYR
jgi:hypothetical protein